MTTNNSANNHSARPPFPPHPTSDETSQRYSKASPETRESFRRLLALGPIMEEFMDENDGRFAFTAETVRDRLKHYVEDDVVFYADAEKKHPFAFNSNLEGLKPGYLEFALSTVMFYQGKDGRVDFVHGGYGLVSFCDGRVTLISREELDDFRWVPK